MRFTTSDDVQLAADLWPGDTAGAPAVVLLHMAPPSNDRAGYPKRVRSALQSNGWTVLNVDRRGAGGSGGEAEEATAEPQARLDVEAAVRFLLDPARDCAVDRERIAIVGASNGTTSAFDYTLDHDASLPDPAALAFLSPGTYTLQNHDASTGDLGASWPDTIPLLWLYPTNEPFSGNFTADAPPAWAFVERGTQHGTRMFDGDALEDATVEDLVGFLAAALNPPTSP